MREKNKSFSERLINIDFDFVNEEPEAVKFVAWWFKVTDIKGYRDPNQTPPIVVPRAIRTILSGASTVPASGTVVTYSGTSFRKP